MHIVPLIRSQAWQSDCAEQGLQKASDYLAQHGLSKARVQAVIDGDNNKIIYMGLFDKLIDSLFHHNKKAEALQELANWLTPDSEVTPDVEAGINEATVQQAVKRNAYQAKSPACHYFCKLRALAKDTGLFKVEVTDSRFVEFKIANTFMRKIPLKEFLMDIRNGEDEALYLNYQGCAAGFFEKNTDTVNQWLFAHNAAPIEKKYTAQGKLKLELPHIPYLLSAYLSLSPDVSDVMELIDTMNCETLHHCSHVSDWADDDDELFQLVCFGKALACCIPISQAATNTSVTPKHSFSDVKSAVDELQPKETGLSIPLHPDDSKSTEMMLWDTISQSMLQSARRAHPDIKQGITNS
ncbi:hypothetical protein D5R81_19290 [Parashewanella spongiae]|uniref:Uncharacterized protein n=1 Tax=Parashewanella spongiae TaxID=342950 RepID=A0A3A6TBH2_9GAMM|nr:hypothetical protein [Parashewanella spongiae]MCL1080209.1 hypothetical protein [Parashewanella spongiae]RJY02335.1 hypothetical protein D5R81_19290 [Parashewanella spongiae]